MKTAIEILTTWNFGEVKATVLDIDVTDQAIDSDRGGWVNYVATVQLQAGNSDFGEAAKIRHTAYITEHGLELATDAQDFDVVNEDLEKAYGVLAKSRIRDIVLAAIHHAASEATLDQINIAQIAAILNSHGDRFSGNNAWGSATEWHDNGFGADDTGEWCEIGVWDAATAAAFQAAGKTPDQIQQAAQSLIDGLTDDEAADRYTDGDPIYSVCNGDTSPEEIIAAC